MAGSDVLSSEDLRNRLFDVLKKKGFVDTLKTQLRNSLVSELRHIGAGQLPGQEPLYNNRNGEPSLAVHAVNSLIAQHLQAFNYDYSLSVFLPEAGLASDRVMSIDDILQLLQITPQSRLYSKLVCDFKAELLIWSIPEEEMRKVDAHFLSVHGDEKYGGRGAAVIEERILSYQRQLEERSSAQLQLQIAKFKQNELVQLRLELNEKTRKQVDKARREMENDYRTKYDSLAVRERNAMEQIHQLQEAAEKEIYGQRQLLLEEIEAVRQREILLRRQEENSNKEKQAWEDRMKEREKLAREMDERGRKLESEYQQRINEQVNKFKQEEQAKYLDRTRSLEYREQTVRDNERRVNEQMPEMMSNKSELRDNKARMHQLEEELICLRQELLAAQKQIEFNTDNSREIANVQSYKENNAVLKKELDTARGRINELTKEVLVERNKQEELLREMGHATARPTSETYVLQKQIEQLQNTLRTERALGDQMRNQTEYRLHQETDRNKELLADYQDQTWRGKQLGWTAADMRQQLIDTKHALNNESMRRLGTFDSFGAEDSPRYDTVHVANSAAAYTELLGDPRLSPISMDGLQCETTTADVSYSSDLVRDTKNRIQRLETEAQKLERNYQEFQFRVCNLDPVLEATPVGAQRTKVTHSAPGMRKTDDIGSRERPAKAYPSDVIKKDFTDSRQSPVGRQGSAILPLGRGGSVGSSADRHGSAGSPVGRQGSVSSPVGRALTSSPEPSPQLAGQSRGQHDAARLNTPSSSSGGEERRKSSPSQTDLAQRSSSTSPEQHKSTASEERHLGVTLDEAWQKPAANTSKYLSRRGVENGQRNDNVLKEKQQQLSPSHNTKYPSVDGGGQASEQAGAAATRAAAVVPATATAAPVTSLDDADAKIDPVMLKYMQMVQQQKDTAKQQEVSESQDEDDVSISEHNSDERVDDIEVEDRSW